MKVVFLDIDGVLCTDRSFARKDKVPFPPDFHIPFRDGWDRLDDECIERLNRITDATGALIVISSTWRLCCNGEEQFQYLIDYLHSQGVKARIIDRTPSHMTMSNTRGRWGRGAEIVEWLEKTGPKFGIESFVIIDDDADMGSVLDYLVQTPEPTGIGEEHVGRAIEILNVESKENS